MENIAFILPQPTRAETQEQINILLDDNADWIVKDIEIVKHDNGEYSAIIKYYEH